MMKPNPSTKDLFILFTNLGSLYKTGIMVQSLTKIRVQHIKLYYALRSIYKMLIEGGSLTKAFEAQNIFPPFVIHALLAGEASNTVHVVLKEIGLYLKLEGEILRRIKSAILPAKIIGAVVAVALFIIVTFVGPRQEVVYQRLRLTLPLLTKWVLAVSTFLVHQWYITLSVFFGMTLAIRWFIKKYPAKVDAILLKIPIYKNLYFYLLQYRFCKGFTILRKSGMSSKDALSYTSYMVGNVVFGNVLRTAVEYMTYEGMDIGEALEKSDTSGLIDFMILSFIESGEETTKTVELLEDAIVDYSDIISAELHDFSTLLPSAVSTILLIILITILLAILFPSLTMVTAIRH